MRDERHDNRNKEKTTQEDEKGENEFRDAANGREENNETRRRKTGEKERWK